MKDIGTIIFELRKARGTTQEELAKFVGVSTQAVSKWENGGMPDVELLPKIADYFNVSIDKLFDRYTTPSNVTLAIFDHIRKTAPDSDERFKAIFELCWDIERSFFNFGGDVDNDIANEGGRIKDYEKMLKDNEQQYSSILSDHGFTRMGIANKLQYFLMVPEIKNTQNTLFENVDYINFFKDLSDITFFNSLIFLFKRDPNKAFTENLLVKELSIDIEKANDIITTLTKYKLVRKTEIELDDEIKDVYTFLPTPSFIAMLIFAKEMIETPNRFAFYSQGRNKPYLK